MLQVTGEIFLPFATIHQWISVDTSFIAVIDINTLSIHNFVNETNCVCNVDKLISQRLKDNQTCLFLDSRRKLQAKGLQ